MLVGQDSSVEETAGLRQSRWGSPPEPTPSLSTSLGGEVEAEVEELTALR